MKTKAFDCVKMKEECQRACEKRYAGLSFEERQKKMEEDILASPILGDFYRRTFKPGGLDAAGKPAAVVAEPKAEYPAQGKN
jgi:hypothetical protein